MAEGGSSIMGSDAFFDYSCSDCLSRNNANTEAVFYCPECNKYLCKLCVACGHDVIGRRNLDKWGEPSTGLQFDPCPSHKANVIQLYCKKHDVVCCPVCGQTNHKLCGELLYIPQVASTKGNTTSLRSVKKDLSELQTKADKLVHDRTTRLANLDNKEQQLLSAVEEHRANLDTWLDNLQEQSINDIRQHKALMLDRYKSEVSICDTITTEMANLEIKLDAASEDESLMFSRLKQGKEQIEDKTHLIFDITSSESADKAQFVPHTQLEQQVKSHHGLGQLLTDPLISKMKTPGLGKVRMSQSQGLGSQAVPLNKPYTVESRTSVNVKVREDKATCDISGMCRMPDGSFIVADSDNKSLKLLDSSYKVTSHCSLTDAPNDVCPTEAGQAAVALDCQAVQLVSVGNKMTKTKTFSTDHECSSLTYSNDCLFVIKEEGTTIHVYNLSGTCLRIISADPHGNQLFLNTIYITASPDGDRLYITDDTGLVTVGTNGDLIAKFTSPDLDGGWAVCVDSSDTVFVTGFESNNVLQLENGERQLAEILHASDKIEPNAICFDGVNLRLLVSENNCDTVHVLHISK